MNLPFATCYIDDIVIWNKTLEEHLEHLSTVIAGLRHAALEVIREGVHSQWKNLIFKVIAYLVMRLSVSFGRGRKF